MGRSWRGAGLATLLCLVTPLATNAQSAEEATAPQTATAAATAAARETPTATATPAPPPTPPPTPTPTVSDPATPRRHGAELFVPVDRAQRDIGWGRAAGWLSIASTALSIAGLTTLLIRRDSAQVWEHATWVGFGVVTAPLIAIGGASSRRRGGVPGHPTARVLGWTSYTWVLAAGAIQIVRAAQSRSVPLAAPLIGGFFTLTGHLALGFEAYASSHQARMRRWYPSLHVR